MVGREVVLASPALRGLATMLARNTHEAPADIFAEVPDTVLPWPEGTLPEALEAYADCMGQELGVKVDLFQRSAHTLALSEVFSLPCWLVCQKV